MTRPTPCWSVWPSTSPVTVAPVPAGTGPSFGIAPAGIPSGSVPSAVAVFTKNDGGATLAYGSAPSTSRMPRTNASAHAARIDSRTSAVRSPRLNVDFCRSTSSTSAVVSVACATTRSGRSRSEPSSWRGPRTSTVVVATSPAGTASVDGVSDVRRVRSVSTARSATSSGTLPSLRTSTVNAARPRVRTRDGVAISARRGCGGTTRSRSWNASVAPGALPAITNVSGYVPAGNASGRSRVSVSAPDASGKSASADGSDRTSASGRPIARTDNDSMTSEVLMTSRGTTPELPGDTSSRSTVLLTLTG